MKSIICPKARSVNEPSPSPSAVTSERRSSPKSGPPQDLLEAPSFATCAKYIGYKDVDHCLD